MLGSLVKLRKDSFHNRKWIGFDNMIGIVIDFESDQNKSYATVYWSDKRLKIVKWDTRRLELL
jgi:hypothetical protein